MLLSSSKCIHIAALAATAFVLGTEIAFAQGLSIRSQWLNTPASRVEALAVLQTLNANLLSNASATLTLDRWCAAHKLAPEGSKIQAQRVSGQDKPADEHIRELLTVGPAELIAYRHVRLVCGDRVLSEADNWYLPAKLTAEMNQALNTSDIAFGRAVQALNFTRTNLSAKLLWAPLSEGWDVDGLVAHETSSPSLPPLLLEHRAVLKLKDGTPFSAVVESYTDKALDFPVPRLLLNKELVRRPSNPFSEREREVGIEPVRKFPWLGRCQDTSHVSYPTCDVRELRNCSYCLTPHRAP